MNDYVLPVERYGGYESAIDWWTLYPILILIAVLVVFAITVLVVVHIVRKQRKERQRMEHRYREARALAKGIINAHLDYNNTMHAVDDATIEAFEAIIEEIAKSKRHNPDLQIGRIEND